MNKRNGLTLLEVVISMALIGMVAIVFLTIFSNGNNNIFRSGKRTEYIYEIQKEVDSQIKSPEEDKYEELIVEVIIDGITTNEKPLLIPGKLIIIEGKMDMKIKTFVPDKP